MMNDKAFKNRVLANKKDAFWNKQDLMRYRQVDFNQIGKWIKGGVLV
jgi:hypothetical protein